MFENRLCVGKPLTWQQVQEEGVRFMSALENLEDTDEVSTFLRAPVWFTTNRYQVRKCPIVLIAHSLGGLILKRVRPLITSFPQALTRHIGYGSCP